MKLCQEGMGKAQKEKDQKQEEKEEIVNKIKGGNIMPRGDRTGPNGLGPRTGRAMGFCSGFNAPGYTNQGFGHYRATEGAQSANRFYGSGRGFGAGRGFGFGRGYGRAGYGRIYAEPMPVQERDYREPSKEEQLKELKAEKKEIDKAIEELEKED